MPGLRCWRGFSSYLHMCPHTTPHTICISSYHCICVLILRCCRAVSSYLYMCPHTSSLLILLLHMCPHICYYICVLILLYMCPILRCELHVCPHATLHTTICVPSYFYVCVLLLLYMCPHTGLLLMGRRVSEPTSEYTTCVSSY